MKIDNATRRYYRTLRPILLQILEEAAEEDRLRMQQGLTLEEVLRRKDRQRTMLDDVVPEIFDEAFKPQEDEKQ
jgi:hypothetical protein